MSEYVRSGFNSLFEQSVTWRRTPYRIHDFTVKIQEIALFTNVLFLGVPVSPTEAALIKSLHFSRHSVLLATVIGRFPPFMYIRNFSFINVSG